VFERGGRLAFTSYGDDANSLLDEQPAAASGLFALTPQSRFLAPRHVNIFACHESRLQEVWSAGIKNVDELIHSAPPRQG
jgi:hypothetical protein